MLKFGSVLFIPRFGVAGVTLALVAGAVVATPVLAAEGEKISGVIWHDYDSNGVRDPAFEEGLKGVKVQATDGKARSAVATTEANGAYSIAVPNDSKRWRVEAWLPGDDPRFQTFRPTVVGGDADTSNGTTVQFVEAGSPDAASVDFSFQVPGAYSPQNPYVYLPMIQFGAHDGTEADRPGGITIRWDRTGGGGQTARVTHKQVGATHGSTVVRGKDPDAPATILAAAYVRRHSGLGPVGVGGIYAVKPVGEDWSAQTAEAQPYVDLAGVDQNGASFGIELGGPDPSVRPLSDPENRYDWVRDGEVYRIVGRAGLGLIAMGPGEKYLYAVNLQTRSLVRIDTDNDLSDPVYADEVTEYFFPGLFPTDSSTVGEREDVRPFGISLDPITGRMYLTATDTAETEYEAAKTPAEEEDARAGLRGYVYSFDPTALDEAEPADAADVLQAELDFPLTYERVPAYQNYRPWETSPRIPSANRPYLPQPMVSSVQILHGNMIIGVRDRKGDLYGYSTYYSPDKSNNARINERASGDILKATLGDPDGDGTSKWILESDGVAGGVDGAGDGEGGPGGSAFFDTFWYHRSNHEALGSIITNPSRADGIMSTAIHSAGGAAQEGTRRFYQDTGAETQGAHIRTTTQGSATYKSNGLGQASLLAGAAPIEIGNYVWYDPNADGVQDPDEKPVVGATVNLYEVAEDGTRTLVSSKVTDEAGQYYFSSEDTEYALKTETDYIVAVDNPADYAQAVSLDDPDEPTTPAGPLYEWMPTAPNTGDPGEADLRDLNDSDGIVDAESAFTEYPFVTLRTGSAGENNHTYDFGFNQVALEFDKRTVKGFPKANPDDDGTWTIEYDLVVSNVGQHAVDYDLTDDLTGYGKGITVTSAEVLKKTQPDGLPVNERWDGREDKTVTGKQVKIPAAVGGTPTTHTYRVRVVVRLDAEERSGAAVPSPAALTCIPDQKPGTDTTGLFNVAVLVPAVGMKITDDECDGLPLVTVEKSLSQVPTPVDSGQYQVSYTLTVTNETDVATDYDLTDTLRFGEGIKVVPGSVTVSADEPALTVADPALNDGFDGTSDTTIVQDRPIADGAVHTYTVAARYTVDLPNPVASPDLSVCREPGVPGEDTAVLNDATTSFNGYPDTDDACANVGDVTHTKSLVSAKPIGEGQWRIEYQIRVDSLGVESTSYTLSDELHYGEGVTVDSATISSSPDAASPTLNAKWDGLESLTIATDVPIAGTDDDGYAPHVYGVTVIANVPVPFTIPDEGINPSTCGEDAVNYQNVVDRAFLNVSTLVDVVGDREDDDACAPIPYPMIEMNKTISSRAVVNPDGSYSISYQVEVLNTGTADTEYELVDDLQYGEGFTVTSSEVISAPEVATVLDTWTGTGEAGNENLVVARDVPLKVEETHTYGFTVTGVIPAATLRNPVAVACPASGEWDQPGGFHNVAIVSGAGQNLYDDVCDTPPMGAPPIDESTPPLIIESTPPALGVTGSDAALAGPVAVVSILLIALGIVLTAARRHRKVVSPRGG